MEIYFQNKFFDFILINKKLNIKLLNFKNRLKNFLLKEKKMYSKILK